MEEIEAVRTDLPGQIEHIIAYAGSTAIAMAGYGLNRGAARIVGCFWLYAATLEYLQNFSPGRTRHLWISQHRRSEHYAAGSLSSSSSAGALLYRAGVAPSNR